MLSLQRHDEIVKILGAVGVVRVSALAEELAVSEMTIRRDLAMLSKAGRWHRDRSVRSVLP